MSIITGGIYQDGIFPKGGYRYSGIVSSIIVLGYQTNTYWTTPSNIYELVVDCVGCGGNAVNVSGADGAGGGGYGLTIISNPQPNVTYYIQAAHSTTSGTKGNDVFFSGASGIICAGYGGQVHMTGGLGLGDITYTGGTGTSYASGRAGGGGAGNHGNGGNAIGAIGGVGGLDTGGAGANGPGAPGGTSASVQFGGGGAGTNNGHYKGAAGACLIYYRTIDYIIIP